MEGFGNDEASVQHDPLVTPADSTRRGRTTDSTTTGAARLAPRRRRAARHSDIRGARQYRAGYRRAHRDATEPGDFYRRQSSHGGAQRRYGGRLPGMGEGTGAVRRPPSRQYRGGDPASAYVYPDDPDGSNRTWQPHARREPWVRFLPPISSWATLSRCGSCVGSASSSRGRASSARIVASRFWSAKVTRSGFRASPI